MSAALVLLAGLLLAAGAAAWSARAADGSARVALVAVLGVVAAAFNVVVPIPSVEATTTVVLCTAIVLGARTATAVALVAIVASSVAGGVGPWTAWQVLAAVGIALAGALVGRAARDVDWYATGRLVQLGCVAALAATGWDVVTTAGSAVALGASGVDGRLGSLLLLGAPFTLTHAAFTATFTAIGGPPLLHALGRARHRLDGGIVALP